MSSETLVEFRDFGSRKIDSRLFAVLGLRVFLGKPRVCQHPFLEHLAEVRIRHLRKQLRHVHFRKEIATLNKFVQQVHSGAEGAGARRRGRLGQRARPAPRRVRGGGRSHDDSDAPPPEGGVRRRPPRALPADARLHAQLAHAAAVAEEARARRGAPALAQVGSSLFS